MNNYKKILIGSLLFFIIAVLAVTFLLKNISEIEEIGDEETLGSENIDQIERERVLDNLDRLLPENQKSEEEKKQDIDLLEKVSTKSNNGSSVDIDLLNRENEEDSEEDKRKKELLESLSN